MKLISNNNDLVKFARKSHVHIYDYLFETTSVHVVYKDKKTNKEYLVDINITDKNNIKINNIEQIKEGE
tara:strand:- start:44 stop:250 length:207 start_codon:yes stop_codon:yes gene_type:complete